MKNIILLLCLLSLPVHAEKLNLEFREVGIVPLLKATYGDIFQRNYILDPAIINDTRKITLTLSGVEKSTLPSLLERTLKESGIEVVDMGEALYLRPVRSVQTVSNPASVPLPSKTAPCDNCLVDLPQNSALPETEPDEYRVYVPKYRSADMLQTIVNSLSRRDSSVSQQPSNQRIVKHDSAVILQGKPDHIDRLEKLLVDLDTAPGDLLVKGMVYEVSHNSREGTAYGIALNLLNSRIGVTAGTAKNLGNAIKLHSTAGIGLDLIASALSSDNRFKAVSAPVLRVKSGESGNFSSGADVPVRSSAQLDKNGNPIQSYEYKPSGVILDIRPYIRSEVIDLSVKQTLSSFTQTTTSGIDSPTMLKRSLTTTVSLQPDDVVMLGGLDETKESGDSSGLPFLPKWLHSSGQDESKTEILLVLQVQKL